LQRIEVKKLHDSFFGIFSRLARFNQKMHKRALKRHLTNESAAMNASSNAMMTPSFAD